MVPRKIIAVGINVGTETETSPLSGPGLEVDEVKAGGSRKELLAGCVTTQDWLAAGFLKIPNTKAELRLAMAARDCLQALDCIDEIKRKLLHGESCPGIAAYVLRVAVPPPRVKTSTLVKYVGAFRTFFLEQPKNSELTEHLPAKMEWPSQPSLFATLIGHSGFEEIEFLEQLLKIQQDRIKNAFFERADNRSRELLCREIREARETAVKLTETKIDLGIYSRSSGGVGPTGISRTLIDRMSPEERKAVVAFGDYVLELMEKIRKKARLAAAVSESPKTN